RVLFRSRVLRGLLGSVPPRARARRLVRSQYRPRSLAGVTRRGETWIVHIPRECAFRSSRTCMGGAGHCPDSLLKSASPGPRSPFREPHRHCVTPCYLEIATPVV